MTASTTRAAAASAGAPGAQGVLAKTAARQHEAVREVAHADRSPSRSLDLRHRESTPTALNDHVVIQYGDDHARIDAFSVNFCPERVTRVRERLRGEDSELLPIETRLGDGLGVERANLALDLERLALEVDARLGLPDARGVGSALFKLRLPHERTRGAPGERLEKHLRPEHRQLRTE